MTWHEQLHTAAAVFALWPFRSVEYKTDTQPHKGKYQLCVKLVYFYLGGQVESTNQCQAQTHNQKRKVKGNSMKMIFLPLIAGCQLNYEVTNEKRAH